MSSRVSAIREREWLFTSLPSVRVATRGTKSSVGHVNKMPVSSIADLIALSISRRYDKIKKWENVQDDILDILRSHDRNNIDISIPTSLQVRQFWTETFFYIIDLSSTKIWFPVKLHCLEQLYFTGPSMI